MKNPIYNKPRKTRKPKSKKRIIYTNDSYEVNRDYYREQMEFEEGRPITENELDHMIDAVQEDDWYSMVNRITEHENKNGKSLYIIRGDLGLWNGNKSGYKVVKGMLSAIHACLEDANTIYTQGRKLCISATHHDGTNNFTIKELTERGEHKWDKSDCFIDYSDLFYDSRCSTYKTLFHAKST